MGLRSGPLGYHKSLPVLWLDGACNQIRRLSHRVEADESGDLVCHNFRLVVSKGCKPRLGIALGSDKFQLLRALCFPLSRYRLNRLPLPYKAGKWRDK